MIGGVLARLFSDDAELSARLSDWAEKRMTNWNGIEVGRIRPAGDLA